MFWCVVSQHAKVDSRFTLASLMPSCGHSRSSKEVAKLLERCSKVHQALTDSEAAAEKPAQAHQQLPQPQQPSAATKAAAALAAAAAAAKAGRAAATATGKRPAAVDGRQVATLPVSHSRQHPDQEAMLTLGWLQSAAAQSTTHIGCSGFSCHTHAVTALLIRCSQFVCPILCKVYCLHHTAMIFKRSHLSDFSVLLGCCALQACKQQRPRFCQNCSSSSRCCRHKI